MTILTETYTLSNGVEIPKVGYGTWMIEDGKAAEAVKKAIELGYRHIDTAQAYQNERGVGEGLRDSGVNRAELFVTTKLAAEIKSYEEAKAAIDGSLELMGLDYIDMIIIHSPKPWQDFHGEDSYAEGNLAAWKALEEAYEAGKLKAIGVSNFQQADLDNLIENGTKYGLRSRVSTERTEDGRVRVIIDDDGPGIPADKRDSVFQPFVRLEDSRNRLTGGTGLGLAIVKKVMDRHKADVTLHEAPSGGLRVVVEMDLA